MHFSSNESPTSPSARYNTVDAAYRLDLKEFNETNFARFDPKLEQRLAEFEVRMIRWMVGLWIATALGIHGLYRP